MVILAKWVVATPHRQGRIEFSNNAYLAWWYTNCMLNVWETVGGTWLFNTKLLILFYRAMGAKVRRFQKTPLAAFATDHGLEFAP